MSTTLTNGIIIPDNGSRNWGGDLANNWNILDLNVGYMTDVKNRVTTLENSVAENTANIQTNASNISALQTSKQDVIEDIETIRAGASAGATAVQPSALSNYVDLSSEQTINGNKTFDSLIQTKDTLIVQNTDSNRFAQIHQGWIEMSEPVYCYIDFKHADSQDYLARVGLNANNSLVLETTDSARISLYSKEHAENSGQLEIAAFNAENKANAFKFTTNGVIPVSMGGILNLGSPTNRWNDIYATNATINTSDRNAKTDIKIIDDNLLDAWDNVSLISFKFKDAVEKKGDNARIHMGYIAQNIQEELSKNGIDACDYGLFCYNSWNAQEEKSHDEQRAAENGTIETVKVIDTSACEAGETFGLRYIECLVVECAYLRKKNAQLENRIAKLEEILKDCSLI